MKSKFKNLQIIVASPCGESWHSMTGDERERFCSVCQRNVFNLSEMTEEEISELLSRSDVCARLYQRKDGTLLTSDCPVGRRVRRRLRVLGTVTASLFSFGILTSAKLEESDRRFSRSTKYLSKTAQHCVDRMARLPLVQQFLEYFSPSHRVVMGKMAVIPPPMVPPAASMSGSGGTSTDTTEREKASLDSDLEVH